MKAIKFKDLPNGQAFYWDEADLELPAPKVKVSEHMYVDPEANGAKHPLRVSAQDLEITVFVGAEAEKVAG